MVVRNGRAQERRVTVGPQESPPPQSTFWPIPLHPLLRYNGKRGPKGHATDRRGGPKVYGTMSMELLEKRREEMRREAQLNRLKKALQANQKRPTVPRWASTVAWELARIAGVLRKSFEAPKNAG
jgi:hypothetical protein